MSEVNKSYNNIGEILLSQDQILTRIDKLAVRITSDFEDSPRITVVGILKGALLFMADLIRRIPLPIECEFVQIKTYESGTAPTRPPEILFSSGFDAHGKHILLVEDIIDTGGTLDYMVRRIAEQQPADLKVCVLLDKGKDRSVEIGLDYIGFEIPDKFVVGYGLDYAEEYRNLPYISALADKIL
ncbi:hypoxanthine phosphoribosyltransferase [Acidobacteriota bacterium]